MQRSFDHVFRISQQSNQILSVTGSTISLLEELAWQKLSHKPLGGVFENKSSIYPGNRALTRASACEVFSGNMKVLTPNCAY